MATNLSTSLDSLDDPDLDEFVPPPVIEEPAPE